MIMMRFAALHVNNETVLPNSMDAHKR